MGRADFIVLRRTAPFVPTAPFSPTRRHGRRYSLATGRRADKTGSNVDVVLVELADITGVLVVVNDLGVVAARSNNGSGTGDDGAGHRADSDARRRRSGTEGGAEHFWIDVVSS